MKAVAARLDDVRGGGRRAVDVEVGPFYGNRYPAGVGPADRLLHEFMWRAALMGCA